MSGFGIAVACLPGILLAGVASGFRFKTALAAAATVSAVGVFHQVAIGADPGRLPIDIAPMFAPAKTTTKAPA